MKTTYSILIILSIVLVACAPTKPIKKLLIKINEHGTIQPLDENGNRLNIEVQRSRIDSLSLQDTKTLNEYLSEFNSEYPSNTDFAYIHFYPGKDRSNSTGNFTRDDIGRINEKFNKEIESNKNISALFLYKNNDGLQRFDKNVNWQKDKDGILERLFFDYHYPGSSYIILHKSGDYFVYYGENYYIDALQNIELFQSSFN